VPVSRRVGGHYHSWDSGRGIAVIESWHSTLEFELRPVRTFTTRAEARATVAAWIEDCNYHRGHSACQMMSPVDHEQALAAGKADRDVLRFSAAQYRHVLGPLQVVPRRGPRPGGSTWTVPALRPSRGTI
jgi:hypothetical protein